MKLLLGSLVLLPTLALAVGALTGRVRARSCCAVDPARDLRMRGCEQGPAALTGASGA